MRMSLTDKKNAHKNTESNPLTRKAHKNRISKEEATKA